VVDGITRHGDDFVLVVEAAGDADGDTAGTPAVTFEQNSVAPAPEPAGRPHPGE
jgi:hypothetical protein